MARVDSSRDDFTLEAAWEALAGDDAAAALGAIYRFADGDAKAADFLRRKLTATAPPSLEEKVKRLIEQLDADEFADRERASERLLAMGVSIHPLLRAQLAATPTPEVETRLEAVLRKGPPVSPLVESPAALQQLRGEWALQLAE